MTDQEKNFVSELMAVGQEAVAWRDKLNALKARYDLNQFGVSITTGELQAISTFAHLDNNKMLLAVTAINALLTTFGSDTSGNVSSFHLLKG